MNAQNKLGQFKFQFHVPFDRDAVCVAAVAFIKIDLSAVVRPFRFPSNG